MSGKPASEPHELVLLDRFAGLSCRAAAALVFGDARLWMRVWRRRQQQKRAREQVAQMSDAGVNELLARHRSHKPR